MVLALAWGAGAFGGVYPWAYVPLLGAAAVLGLSGLTFGRGRWPPPSLLLAFLAIAVGTAVQLVPVSIEALEVVSPRTVDIHRQYDVAAAVGARTLLPISIRPQQTVIALLLFAGFALLLLGTSRMLSRNSARHLAASLAVVGVVLSIVGIVQRSSFNGRVYGVWPLVQGGAPFGPFINRNHFAGWMVMVLPLTVGLFGSIVSREFAGVRPEWRSRVMWFATAAANKAILTASAVMAMTLAVVLTLSRSGITALAVALVFASFMMLRRQTSANRPIRMVIPIYVLATTFLAFAWVGIDRIAARFAVAGPQDVESRHAIWFDTWRMIHDFWLTGTGVNTFGVAALYYQEQLKGTHMQEAHNDYLQIAAEGGVLLAVPVAIAIAALVLNLHRRLQHDVGSIWWLRVGAISGLLAIAVQSLVEFSLQIPANAALFAVVCGIALHDGGADARKIARPRTPQAEHRHQAVHSDKQAVRSDKIVRFGAPDQNLDFAIDQSVPPPTERSDLDLAELDDLPARERFREPADYDRRSHRQVYPGNRQFAGLIALALISLFVMLVLFWRS